MDQEEHTRCQSQVEALAAIVIERCGSETQRAIKAKVDTTNGQRGAISKQ